MSARGDRLTGLLVEFAGTLCTEFSVQDILDRLVLRIVDVLDDVSGCGVLVVDGGEELHFVAASDERVLTVEDAQRDLDDSPCQHAYRSGRAVHVPDLAVDERFPQFSARALRSGIAAVFSFPLRVGDAHLGALDLYRTAAGPLSPHDARTAETLADVAAAYLVNARVRSASSSMVADLNHRSLHDPLTGLPNRVLLAELLGEALARARRTRRRTAVMFVDLDGFKAVNDRYGHRAGDLLLVAVAARLTAALRPGDLLARLGGDEFVAVCEDLPDGSRAADVAHRLLTAMATPFHVDGHEVTLSASVGTALADRRAPVSAEQMLADADEAMYRAKREGGNGHRLRQSRATARPPVVAVPDARPGRPVRDGAWRGGPAAPALERFTAAYQPIVALGTGSVSAFEALLRWRSTPLEAPPGAGSAEVLVGEAERAGSILGLGEWMLRRACQDARAWRAAGTGPLTSVNVAAQQVTGPSFVRTVETVLGATGADPAGLCVELTESSELPTDRRTVDVLRALKDLGVQVWLDDFGSGYTSLDYLRVFPVDAVKVDPGFAARLPVEAASRAIVGSVVGLCHALGMSVTVEGVETEQELRVVEDLGADCGQGHHFGRPVAAAEAVRHVVAPAPS